MRKFHNFDNRDVPKARPHADRYARFTRNASGRAAVFEGRDRWIASDTVVEVRR